MVDRRPPGRWRQRTVTTATLTAIAVANMGADGGCSNGSNQTAQCDSIGDSWDRARCLDDARRGGGGVEAQPRNELSAHGAQLMKDMLATYAQGKPFPWKNYRYEAVEDRNGFEMLKDGDVLNTVVFPRMAESMIGPGGEQTHKTNAIAHCAVALVLDNERYGPFNASLEGAIAGALVGLPVPGAVVGAGTYLEVRDKILPYLLREGLKEEEAAIAGGESPLDAENNGWYAAARSLCDDTFPVHGLGSFAKGWSGANPLKPTSESEVRQLCGTACDGSPNPLTGKGPPLPLIVGLADGFVPVSYEMPDVSPAPRNGPTTEVFARRKHLRLQRDTGRRARSR